MKVSQLIEAVKHRAGVQGDPYYESDPNEIVRVLQTAFEPYWFTLASRRPAEIERQTTVTGQATVTLPADCMTVRSLVRLSDGLTLVRSSRNDFTTGSINYDFDYSNLYCGDGLTNVSLKLTYIPKPPTLATSNPTNDPSVWTEIDERLFPENGIVLGAIAELLAKDQDPRAQYYEQRSDKHFQIWAASLLGERLGVASGGAQGQVAELINQILQLSGELKPDHAGEHAVLSLINQAIGRIHREIESVARSVIKKSYTYTGGFTTNPTSIALPSDAADVLLVLVNDGTAWTIATSGDHTTHPEATRSGGYFWSYDSANRTVELFWEATLTAPTGAKVSYLPQAPQVTVEGTYDQSLYPADLIIDYALGHAAQNEQIRQVALTRFEKNIKEFVLTLRSRYLPRGQADIATRQGLIAAIRSILSTVRGVEWDDQLIEVNLDLVQEELARKVRTMFQDFAEVEKQYTLSGPNRTTQYDIPDPWLQILQVKYIPEGLSGERNAQELIKADKHESWFPYVWGYWDNLDRTLVFSGDGLNPGTLVVRMVLPPSSILGNLSLKSLDRLLYPPDVMIYRTVLNILGQPGLPQEAQAMLGFYTRKAELVMRDYLNHLNTVFRRETLESKLPFRGSIRRYAYWTTIF